MTGYVYIMFCIVLLRRFHTVRVACSVS